MNGALIAGVDEAGRGCLAGPVVAAAVILDRPIEGLRDSKQLSAAQRERLALQIRSVARAWAVAEASVDEIDRLNILQASLLAMRRAVAALSPPPTHVRVDGNQDPHIGLPTTCVIGGDRRHDEIMAASILAKVGRDALLCAMARDWPGYGFDRHKGYGTAAHLSALQRLGPGPMHRMSFAPCAALGAQSRGAQTVAGVDPA